MIDIDKLISLLVDDDRKSVEAMLSTMNDGDRRYMLGYIEGFTDALQKVDEIERDMTGFHNRSDSDTISS